MTYPRYLVAAMFLVFPAVMAAPGRIDGLADRLAATADSLASESYRGFRERDRGNRLDVEAMFLAQQFSASAALFRRMVADRRPESELRDSIAILNEQIRNSQRFGFGQREWREMARMIEEITREIGGSRDRWDERDRRDNSQSDRITGRMRWRGRIDDQVDLFVQGGTVTPKVVTGGRVQTNSVNFTSSLPNRPVNVDVHKIRGRGEVRVVQQPARDNGFTTVIQIRDSKGGSDDYELELVW